MWSMVSKSPYTSVNLDPALTLHNGQILTMSANGEVSTFNPQLCQWTVLDDMRMGMDNKMRLLVSSNNNLYSVVDFKTQVQQRQGLHGGGLRLTAVRGSLWEVSTRHTDCTVFLYNPKSKWVKINEIGSSPLKSAAVVGGTLFVLAGEKMFKLTLPLKPKLEGNTKLPPPTTTDFNYDMQTGTGSLSGINTIP